VNQHLPNKPTTNLTSEDYALLAGCWITPEIADAVGLYRVNSIEGRDLVCRKGGGDYGGIVFPYRDPCDGQIVLHRLRLDHPPVEVATGKPEHKYLSPPGARNHLYFPPCATAPLGELLSDTSVPILITEGEKKCLALWRAALESGNGTGKPAFLPIAVAGVWNFRGTVSVRVTSRGERVPEKGVIPDFDRIAWRGRKATILFDLNVATNKMVRAARRALAAELLRRGSDAHTADLPASEGVNGIDDYLGQFGLGAGLSILQAATRYDWRADLIRDKDGKILPVLANVITALRGAPEWYGALAFNEFTLGVTTVRDTPWGAVTKWSEQDDRLCTNWMQHHGIMASDDNVAKAVETVARDRAFHPVREYLDQLKWDGTQRLDSLLTLYLGAEPSDVTQAFGAKWMISAVARIYEPGCKADQMFNYRRAAGGA
jgi:hypothetical protein